MNKLQMAAYLQMRIEAVYATSLDILKIKTCQIYAREHIMLGCFGWSPRCTRSCLFYTAALNNLCLSKSGVGK